MKHGHRKEYCGSILAVVFRISEISFSRSFGKLVAEGIQRGVGLVTGRFDFYGANAVDELENRTGIDFFCNLPDDVEEKVESNVKANFWAW